MPERLELLELRKLGFTLDNPHEAVELFETGLAHFAGAKFAVAVDSCTHAIELSLRYLSRTKRLPEIHFPRRCYPSIPMLGAKLGFPLHWTEEAWRGTYTLHPLPVVDASLRFGPGMYQPGTFFCLSFQQKKRLAIGRGGMILFDDEQACQWLKRACYDGRDGGRPWKDQEISQPGYHYYLTPEDAARGYLLWQELLAAGNWADLGGFQDYPDISRFPVFRSPAAE